MKKVKQLLGRRLVVTRSRQQAGALRELLLEAGAEVLELPLIEIIPESDPPTAEDVFAEISHYDWLVFTSANGVKYFFDLFYERFEDIRALGLLRIAVVGEATAKALARRHLKVDLKPEIARGEELAEALRNEQTLDNVKILVVTGNLNRDVLVKQLEEARAIVDTLAVYKTLPADLSDVPAARSFREKGADAIIFTSSSTVKSFVGQASVLQLGKGALRPLTCSIGTVTSETMREAGMPVDMEAATPSMESILHSLLKRFGRRE